MTTGDAMATPERAPAALLAFEGVQAAYDRMIIALRGVSLVVPKAPSWRSSARMAPERRPPSSRLGVARGGGGLDHGGRDPPPRPHAHGVSARERVREGMVQVLEGTPLLPHLTVEENLRSGALVRRTGRAQLRADLERMYSYFPRLTQVRKTRAGFTSGGEQQMVAIGRALMSRPTLVLLDEPSMGLAPLVVQEIFGNRAGVEP